MAIGFDVLCTDPTLSLAERRQVTVRIIGEILPFVIAKYQSGPVARRANAEQAPQPSRRFKIQ